MKRTNRRGFLKSAALVAGASVVAGCATGSRRKASKSPWVDLQVNGRISVLYADGFLRSPKTNSLAGSSCLMKQCVETLMSPEVGLSYSDCLKIARENPLRLIGMEGWTA